MFNVIDAKWINISKVICKDAVKPCHFYPACPYGTLVELFPLNYEEYSCEIFGHDCPIFYHVEGIIEYSSMVEREVGITPEANNISPTKSYDSKIFWNKFFNGLSKFVRTNLDSIELQNYKEQLIKGFEKIVQELQSK